MEALGSKDPPGSRGFSSRDGPWGPRRCLPKTVSPAPLWIWFPGRRGEGPKDARGFSCHYLPPVLQWSEGEKGTSRGLRTANKGPGPTGQGPGCLGKEGGKEVAKGRGLGPWILGVVLILAIPAWGVDIGRWDGPDLGLGLSRALVRYLLGSPDAVAGRTWVYVVSGSREIDLGFVDFSSGDMVCVAAQRYRPGGVSAVSLVELLQRQGFVSVVADGHRWLLTGEDGSSGQAAFFLVLSPDLAESPSRGPLLATLDERPWRALLEGEDRGRTAWERRFVAMMAWPRPREGESRDGAP